MTAPSAWLWFWEAAMAFSTVCFAGITLVVAVKGGRELIQLFRRGIHRG